MDGWVCAHCRAISHARADRCYSCGQVRPGSGQRRSWLPIGAALVVLLAALFVTATVMLSGLPAPGGGPLAGILPTAQPTSTASRPPRATPPGIVTPRPTPSRPAATAQPTFAPIAAPAIEPTAQPGPTPAPPGRPEGRECVDRAYSLAGYRYQGALQWRFNAASVPSGLAADEVLEVIQRAFDNVTDARNLCGRPDDVAATARYLGTTNASVCPDRHFRNFSVVGFGPLDEGDLAFMCPWTYRDETKLAVTDIIINGEEQWALSLASCTGDQVMLEAVVTHEVGHAFGLDHVKQRRHPDLTMRPRIGPCDNGPSTLGLGDLLGLEELYGTAEP